jgi:hypothetical protein
LAENLEMNLNRVFPGGKLAEVGCLFFFVTHIYLYIQSILSPFQSASRFDLFELVSMGKFFEENVTEFMETKVKDLRPVCNFVHEGFASFTIMCYVTPEFRNCLISD